MERADTRAAENRVGGKKSAETLNAQRAQKVAALASAHEHFISRLRREARSILRRPEHAQTRPGLCRPAVQQQKPRKQPAQQPLKSAQRAKRPATSYFVADQRMTASDAG